MKRITRVAAYGLIVRDDRLVLCRISSALPRDQGRWTLPGGGLEFGEDPAAAVVREVQEETGLEVRPLEVVRVDANRVDVDEIAYHAIRIVYRVELLGGELVNEVEGTTDLCAWLTPREAARLRLVRLAKLGLDLAFPALASRD
jgi:8-oxo-dGTP diphosphatase